MQKRSKIPAFLHKTQCAVLTTHTNRASRPYRSQKSEVRGRILQMLQVYDSLQLFYSGNPKSLSFLHGNPKRLSGASAQFFFPANRRRFELCRVLSSVQYTDEVRQTFAPPILLKTHKMAGARPSGARRGGRSEQMVHVSQKETGNQLTRSVAASRPRALRGI